MGVDALDIGIKLKILKKQGKPSTQRWLLGELRKDGFPDLSESTLSSILSGNYVVGCANEVDVYKRQDPTAPMKMGLLPSAQRCLIWASLYWVSATAPSL